MKFCNDEQRTLLSCRPRITSPASVAYRDEEAMLTGEDSLERYRHEILPHKLSRELEYVRTKTFWSDIKIILGTLRRL